MRCSGKFLFLFYVIRYVPTFVWWYAGWAGTTRCVRSRFHPLFSRTISCWVFGCEVVVSVDFGDTGVYGISVLVTWYGWYRRSVYAVVFNLWTCPSSSCSWFSLSSLFSWLQALGCVLGWSRALSLSVLVWATLRRTCRCCFLLRLVPRKTYSHCHTLVILTVERRICCSRFYHMQFLLFPRWPLRHARGFTLLWPVAKCGSSMSWRCRSSSFGWTHGYLQRCWWSCVGEELSDFVHGGVLASFRLDFAKCLFSSILVHNGKFNFTPATDCEVRGVSWGPPSPSSPPPQHG